MLRMPAWKSAWKPSNIGCRGCLVQADHDVRNWAAVWGRVWAHVPGASCAPPVPWPAPHTVQGRAAPAAPARPNLRAHAPAAGTPGRHRQPSSLWRTAAPRASAEAPPPIAGPAPATGPRRGARAARPTQPWRCPARALRFRTPSTWWCACWCSWGSPSGGASPSPSASSRPRGACVCMCVCL